MVPAHLAVSEGGQAAQFFAGPRTMLLLDAQLTRSYKAIYVTPYVSCRLILLSETSTKADTESLEVQLILKTTWNILASFWHPFILNTVATL